MNIKKSNLEIINEIKQKGYCVLVNCFSNNEPDEMKGSLLDALNYIQPDGETDLQKYYKVRKFDRKLKGNWYDTRKRQTYLHNCIHLH